jgi:hypothetical protein
VLSHVAAVSVGRFLAIALESTGTEWITFVERALSALNREA